MKRILLALTCLLFVFSCKSRQVASEMTSAKDNFEEVVGNHQWSYDGYLVVNNNHFVRFLLKKENNSDHLILQNGQEEIVITDFQITADSIHMVLPVFYSRIDAKISGSKLEGNWLKYPGAEKEYKMHFRAFSRNQKVIIPKKYSDYDLEVAATGKETASLAGKWKVDFSPDSEDHYPAIGEFQQDGQNISGTFLTETGDYRFLSGKIYGDKFHLSTFDGSHAFLFEGTFLSEKEIKGKFYSGTHWSEPFVARLDPDVQLGDPYELTYLNEGFEHFDFSFTDVETQKTVSLNDSRFDNKVVLVQIFGSWCPNCMDESVLYAELSGQYKAKGLEVVGIAFERSENLDEKTTELLKRYQSHFGINYPILFGGKASKKFAAEQFPMLNHVMSFPTSIIIDKKKNVREIHTGFNGPATSGYSNFVSDLTKKLEGLLDE